MEELQIHFQCRTVGIAFAPHDSDRGEAELVRQRVPEPDTELQA